MLTWRDTKLKKCFLESIKLQNARHVYNYLYMYKFIHVCMHVYTSLAYAYMHACIYMFSDKWPRREKCSCSTMLYSLFIQWENITRKNVSLPVKHSTEWTSQSPLLYLYMCCLQKQTYQYAQTSHIMNGLPQFTGSFMYA